MLTTRWKRIETHLPFLSPLPSVVLSTGQHKQTQHTEGVQHLQHEQRRSTTTTTSVSHTQFINHFFNYNNYNTDPRSSIRDPIIMAAGRCVPHQRFLIRRARRLSSRRRRRKSRTPREAPAGDMLSASSRWDSRRVAFGKRLNAFR